MNKDKINEVRRKIYLHGVIGFIFLTIAEGAMLYLLYLLFIDLFNGVSLRDIFRSTYFVCFLISLIARKEIIAKSELIMVYATAYALHKGDVPMLRYAKRFYSDIDYNMSLPMVILLRREAVRSHKAFRMLCRDIDLEHVKGLCRVVVYLFHLVPKRYTICRDTMVAHSLCSVDSGLTFKQFFVNSLSRYIQVGFGIYAMDRRYSMCFRGLLNCLLCLKIATISNLAIGNLADTYLIIFLLAVTISFITVLYDTEDILRISIHYYEDLCKTEVDPELYDYVEGYYFKEDVKVKCSDIKPDRDIIEYTEES